MICFESYKQAKIEDVAKFERAKADVVYPAGCSVIQVSASQGGVGYLNEPGSVESKYAVIFPPEGMNSKYLFIVIEKNIHEFLARYKSGLNFQLKDIGRFPLQIHNLETQQAIVMMYERIEEQERIIEAEIRAAKELKSNMLANMLV